MKAEDLYRLKSAVDPNISPDGKEFVYIQTHIDEEKKEYISNLFYMDLKTRKEEQWTFDQGRVSTPKWSPDGSRVAFVSNRSGKNQIYLLSKSGGEARQLTEAVNGAQNPVWSPCGEKVAFTLSLSNDETIHLKAENNDTDDPKDLEPLVVEKMKYKSDANGFLDDKKSFIAIKNLKTDELIQITSANYHTHLQSWSPDGSCIAYTADELEEDDFSFKNDVYLYHLESKETEKITGGKGIYWTATWSQDSRFLSFIGHTREFENATHSKIWLYNRETRELTCFTEEFDAPVGDYMVGDFHQGAVNPGVQWTSDHQGFYFMASDHGNTALYYGNVSGEIYPAVVEEQHIYGFSLQHKEHKGIIAVSKPTLPGEFYSIDLEKGELEQLTHINDSFIEDIELSHAEPFEFQGPEGWSVQGWIMKPAGFKENEKYPTILEIHGGPHAMYGQTYMHEFQMLTAQGYAVIFVNPRGSHGYGQAFVNAVRGDYGGNDYADIMAGVDYALSQFEFIDQDRLGVTGGSYGGFMTNWIIGHTDIFKAAVTQRCISNWISFYGVSDIGYYFSEWQIGADLNDIEKLWKHSPLAYVGKMDTPLLIIHSEKDYRCPIEQAEQLFIALKRQKKTVKMIRFPESNHELSRSGKPNLRIKRLESIRDWFKESL
ncbi:S9 family peptidase [Falsibacillus albus]|uniref:S9 family peptidase n=2 Tax=Falsibacillus albus TaxID=2478915 RepID=A0A3L7K381_9BACI|nr:S9 family peptidase [Falsibacillus albus]RLQ97536.1 S9 family peptidase [Falsibacillus albus]